MSKKLLVKGAKINPIVSEPSFADILIEDGKIKEIGQNLSEEGAEIIDAEGMFAFPGFIDAHCHIGAWEEGTGPVGIDINEGSDPVTPQLRGLDAVNPMDEAFTNAVIGGVTCVATGPGSGNVIGGTFTVLKTYGKRIDNMAVKENLAMKCAFGENPKRFYGTNKKMPVTRMAVAGLLRETLYKAKNYQKAKDSEDGVDFDLKYEALLPVLNKEIPLKAHCHRADDIFTAIRIAKEFDLRMTLDHCTEAHLIADELEKENYPIIMGPTFGDKSKIELREKSFDTPRVLFEHGIRVSIMTDAPVIPIDALPMCAALAYKNGLPYDEALKAITINPGSLEVGKDADIVLWDREDPLSTYAKTKYVIIDGNVVHKDV